MKNIIKYFKSYRGDLLVIVVLLATNFCTWFFSSHDIIWGKNINPDGTRDTYPTPWVYSTKEALYSERKLANSLFEMLHMYYMHDIECNIHGDTISKHIYWDDVISTSKSYDVADSILEHDWEDFYEECWLS